MPSYRECFVDGGMEGRISFGSQNEKTAWCSLGVPTEFLGGGGGAGTALVQPKETPLCSPKKHIFTCTPNHFTGSQLKPTGTVVSITDGNICTKFHVLLSILKRLHNQRPLEH